MNNVWLEIVHEALHDVVRQSGTAVPGAKLRSAVAKVAAARSLEFPPPEMGKFSSFIESFPADFIVHRQPGRDILVVPTSQADLLTVENPYTGSSKARVREDLFEALTRIPDANGPRPYYRPETDVVVWVNSNEQVPSSAIALPEATYDQELTVRRQFAHDLEADSAVKQALEESLDQPAPLRTFSHLVSIHGFGRQWHQFRLGALSRKLREWSVSKAISWHRNWVDLAEPRVIPAHAGAQSITLDSKRQLFEMASLLSDEDLSRISVPLDIVLRLLSRK